VVANTVTVTAAKASTDAASAECQGERKGFLSRGKLSPIDHSQQSIRRLTGDFIFQIHSTVQASKRCLATSACSVFNKFLEYIIHVK
jgi:hypothetical protein